MEIRIEQEKTADKPFVTKLRQKITYVRHQMAFKKAWQVGRKYYSDCKDPVAQKLDM